MVRIGQAQRELALKMKTKPIDQKKQNFIKEAFAKKKAYTQKHASLKERVSVRKGGHAHAHKVDHAVRAGHAKKAEAVEKKPVAEVRQRDSVSIRANEGRDTDRSERRAKVAKVVKRIVGFLRGRWGRPGGADRTEQKPINKPEANPPQVLGKPSAGNGATQLEGEEGNGGTSATVTLKPQGGPTLVEVKPTLESKPVEIKGVPETKLDPKVIVNKGRPEKEEAKANRENDRTTRKEMRLARKLARKLRFRPGIQKRMISDQAAGGVLSRMEMAAQKVQGAHKMINMEGLKGNKAFSITGLANAQGDFITDQKSAGSIYSRGAVATSLNEFEKPGVKGPSMKDKLSENIGGSTEGIADYMSLANEQAALIADNPEAATEAQGAIQESAEEILSGLWNKVSGNES